MENGFLNIIDVLFSDNEEDKIFIAQNIVYLVIVTYNLQKAKDGDSYAKDNLCQELILIKIRIGPFSKLLPALKKEIGKSIKWLKTTGIKTDFRKRNPEFWITNLKGEPIFRLKRRFTLLKKRL